MFGRQWPLTVPAVVVACPVSSAVVARVDGVTYAVNGTAKTFADEYGWRDGIDPIWAPDPQLRGLKIDISPVLDYDLDLCES